MRLARGTCGQPKACPWAICSSPTVDTESSQTLYASLQQGATANNAKVAGMVDHSIAFESMTTIVMTLGERKHAAPTLDLPAFATRDG